MTAIPGSKEKRRLSSLIYGYIGTHVISAATSLGIFDALGTETLTAGELAVRLGCDEHHLKRLLRGLSTYGLVEWTLPDSFMATAMGGLLRRDTPGSYYAAVETGFDVATRDNAWHSLAEAIKTGGIAFDMATGQSFFSFLEQHQDYNKTFYKAMETTLDKAFEAISLFDFSRFKTVCDVGGANGALMEQIMQCHPHLRATIYDRQDTFGQMSPTEKEARSDRGIQLIAGNFFQSVPTGYDAYLLSRVIDDYDDPKARLILSNVCKAMSPESSLLVVQSVIPEGDRSWDGTIADLNMLVFMGGKKRTRSEVEALCANVGLSMVDVKNTGGRHMSFEFKPAC